MTKKNLNPITENLQEIIKEANLHSEKRLKKNNLSRFTGTSTQLDIHKNPQKIPLINDNKDTKNRVLKSNKDVKNNKNIRIDKNIQIDKDIKDDINLKTPKKIYHTRNNNNSHKKQRKCAWQKKSFAQEDTHISLIDNRISMKKLRGKSILCVGGVRSGKSDFALAWANTFEGNKAFIATMQTPKAFMTTQNSFKKEKISKTSSASQAKITKIDEINNESTQGNMELENRIFKHQAQRGKHWITIEEPIDIIGAIHKAKENKCSVVIIDCLTLWLTNLILQEKSDKHIFNKIEELADLLKNPPLPLAIVSNEVGAGVVPENALARRFRDLQGKANQILAKNANNVIATLCGLPILLKS